MLKLYEEIKAKSLKLDISRGKPSPEQLDLSMDMLNIKDFQSESGDCRNYGMLDGIPEAKKLFADMLGVGLENTVVCGNSSLNIMYYLVSLAFSHGVLEEKPWGTQKIKFLCPSPGYDRHFSICEFFGIEMICIPMTENGPDMNIVENAIKDSSVKGIWCVPQYSNPTGAVYSDETVKRFANLKPAAKDFRIFWDNAYCLHHLVDKPKTLLNILTECEKAGNLDLVYIFCSTSKISFSGAGVAAMAASKNNIENIKKALSICTIGYDKMNQLRHVAFFKDLNGLKAQMIKHRAIIQPKFDIVLEVLESELKGIGNWNKPEGGYFISYNAPKGTAKRTVQLAKEAGVVMTPAGATFPYGKDPDDSNIRISPTYPPVDELKQAMELLALCVKIAVNGVSQ
ncbi:MAG: aminotransferase class I/II-fold pyridoxal phosphate-dependent enzyme [Oscillospiraceae bacterium]|jgi:DNA-binding transcriptional MocR family regulator|nr:aminotransferase class I/II-fold pyridoxal phosphate-dependent enzyme [Oscillospiraceae bacterium]